MSNNIRILYVHGYLGSGNGHSSQLIRNEFVSRGVSCILDAPDFPVTRPEEMRNKLYNVIEKNEYDYAIASSLGAFYTMQIPGIKKILINIALPDNLRKIRDQNPESNPELSDELLIRLDKEKDSFFSNIFNEEIKQETYVIYGSRDQIAPNEEILSRYFDDNSRVYHIDMDHKLDEMGAKTVCTLITQEI